MIQKERQGRGFRGLLAYVFRRSRELGHDEAHIVATNMAARTPRDLAAEFGAFRALNPRVSQPVYHCALRLPEGERLDDAQWASFARDYLEGMGFTRSPYVVVRHAPGHVHLVASRVRCDGSRVDLWHSHWRGSAIVYRLEDRYSLSHAVDRVRPRRGQSCRHALRERIDQALGACDGTREHLARALEELGVTVTWRLTRKGEAHGASFALQDDPTDTVAHYSGSRLGRAYAWSGLSARLAARVEAVERERDPVHMRAAHEGGEDVPADISQPLTLPDPTRPAKEERSVDGASSPTTGKEEAMEPRWERRALDIVIAREAAEAIFARARERGLDRGGRFDVGSAGINVWSEGEHTERIGSVSVTWRTPTDAQVTIRGVAWNATRPQALHELARAWEELGGERPRELAVRNEPAAEEAQRDPPWFVRPSSDDRTLQAVFRQLVGMRAERYEVGVRSPERGMLLRTFDIGELLESAPWLKAMNAQGHDIYVRPAGSVGLVLVDDLSRSALDRLRLAGLDPAAVIETSPGNHQAWVRLSWEPLPPSIATAAARELAARFEGDPNAADWRHFGRLAGFTNRKPERTRPDGLHPFVHVVEASGREAPLAHRLLDDALARLEVERAREHEQAAPLQMPAVEHGRADVDVRDEFRRRVDRLLARTPDPDYSRIDWLVCKRLIERHPGLGSDALAQALREGSPRLEERKGRHVEDYVRRTVQRALGARVRGREDAPSDPAR